MYEIKILSHTKNGDNMDIHEAIMIIPRSIIGLLVLFLATRLIGKKQVSELSLFDYVIGISIGNFAAEMIVNMEVQYINGVIAIITFGIIAYLVSILSMKSILIRRLVVGVPTIIIENGNILLKSLKKAKIDINDLLEQARSAGYFDLSTISYAIMEANGKISFLEKDPEKQPTKKDLNIKTKPDSLTANIIIDSKLMPENIKNTDKSYEWFIKQLKIKGYDTYENILLATYANNTLTIFPKNKDQEPVDVLE